MELLGKRSRKTDDGKPAGARMARGLGWFSIGLGLTEVAMPRMLARVIGVQPAVRTDVTMRAMGAREIVNGVAVLLRPANPLPMWSRVLGDMMDIALLGRAMSGKRNDSDRLKLALFSVLGVTAMDVVTATRLHKSHSKTMNPVTRTVTVNRPVHEVYAFWRDLEQLPQFMVHLESVRAVDDMRSHWVAKLPIGGTVSWDAEIVEDRPNEVIAWRSLRGAKLPNKGRVTFTPTLDGMGTELRVEMQVAAVNSVLGIEIAKWFAGPQIDGDLRRFKQVMETGEIVHSDASIHRGMHAAYPDHKEMMQ